MSSASAFPEEAAAAGEKPARVRNRRILPLPVGDLKPNDDGNYRKRPGHVPSAKRDHSKPAPIRVRADMRTPIGMLLLQLVGSSTRRTARQMFGPAAAVVLLLLMLTSTGCATTPQQKAYDAHKAYTIALTATDELVESHKLSLQQDRTALELIGAADAALALVDATVPQGGNGIDAALEKLYETLGRMAALKASAATQPAHPPP